MERARRHHRALAASAFGLLALVAELAGRSLTHRLNVGRHVESPSYSGADYYPFLVGAVKIGVALLLARLAWRFVRARSAARAARGLLAHVAAPRAPRPRLELSPRLWALAFGTTSLFYLVQTDAEGISNGRWPPVPFLDLEPDRRRARRYDSADGEPVGTGCAAEAAPGSTMAVS